MFFNVFYSHIDVFYNYGWQKSRFWAYLALVPAVSVATCQVLWTGSPVDDGHHLASYDTSLVVSNGSDKSVAYVTKNKKTLLYVLYC